VASVRSLTPFHADGRFVADGEILDASDPIVTGRESLFAPVADDAPAPAEKRVARKTSARKAQG
jgi:hypothetical protein